MKIEETFREKGGWNLLLLLSRINGIKKLDATFSAPIFGMVQKICNKYYGVFLKNFEKITSYTWIVISFRNNIIAKFLIRKTIELVLRVTENPI